MRSDHDAAIDELQRFCVLVVNRRVRPNGEYVDPTCHKNEIEPMNFLEIVAKSIDFVPSRVRYKVHAKQALYLLNHQEYCR